MPPSSAGEEEGTETAAAPRRAAPRLPQLTPRRLDLAAIGAYWIAAVAVLSHLWLKPHWRSVSPNWQDQYLFEWLLAHAARSVTHLENPLFSARMNVPDGVNMMANTSALGITLPLTPVTLAFGPAVSYVLWATAALALTATTWYLFFHRGLKLTRSAAFIGGAFCGFAPAMISHLHGQPNISSLFVVPLILWQVMRLTQPGPVVRRGAVLGLLITYQAFVNEEILFITAWVCAVLAIAYAAMRWSEALRVARQFAIGLGVAAAVAAVLLAYPLWFQFFGPQHYRSLPHQFQDHVADLGSWTAYSVESLGGLRTGTQFSLTPVENNTFYGWPLVVLVALIVVWFRRELVVRLAAIVGALFAVLALGDELRYGRRPTGIPGPWRLLDSIPPFSMVVPTRLGIVVTAAVGVLLAVAVHRIVTAPVPSPQRMPSYRTLWLAALTAALLPLVPTRLNAVPREPAPVFLSSGAWQEYVSRDQSVVPLPLAHRREERLDGMAWAAETMLAFRIPHGYFLGPDPDHPERGARFGSAPTAFSELMSKVEKNKTAQAVSPEQRAELIEDLRRWNAAILVLPRDDRRAAAIRATVEEFAGPAQPVSDVWLWDVRSLVAGG